MAIDEKKKKRGQTHPTYIYLGNSTISCFSPGDTLKELFFSAIFYNFLTKVHNCLMSLLNQRKLSKGQNNIKKVFPYENVCYSFFLEYIGTKNLDLFIISSLFFLLLLNTSSKNISDMYKFYHFRKTTF